jgi:hypothetical protein
MSHTKYEFPKVPAIAAVVPGPSEAATVASGLVAEPRAPSLHKDFALAEDRSTY